MSECLACACLVWPILRQLGAPREFVYFSSHVLQVLADCEPFQDGSNLVHLYENETVLLPYEPLRPFIADGRVVLT